MERAVAVYLPHDVEAGSWRVRPGAEPQFSQPLGDDSTIHERWSAPAGRLGLQLLAGLGADGQTPAGCWSGPQLRLIVAEVSRLEAWWVEADLPSAELADLREAGGCVREAAGVAEACGGWLVIR